MTKPNKFAQAVSNSPFLWGAAGSAIFYLLIAKTPLGVPLAKRYFTHHPVEYMLTIMFAVGLAALVLKMVDVLRQRARLNDLPLGEMSATPQSVEECDNLLAMLDDLPQTRQRDYYIQRLRGALEHVRSQKSAESLDDELKYLSDMDAARLGSGYGLFRVIVWAIPILGFLGTVIGITMALNAVDLQSPDQSMLQVLNGLGLKFDTTALALTLSMALMFVHFPVERLESSLLDEVDRCVQMDFAGRFALVPSGGDGQVAAIRSMTQAMLQATELIVRRQSELWQASVEVAAQQWAQMATQASAEVKTAMTAAVGELSQRAEVLERAVVATGEVAKLENSLNQNLEALASSKHFEQTVLSLAAAVNMLGSRLSELPNGTPVKLDSPRRSQAA
jgi:biopolymer transport protein ExbB/TolQ